MPEAILARIRDGDPAFWKSATRSAPIVVQIVIAATIGLAWLLSNLPIDGQAAFPILSMTAITVPTAASLPVGLMLLRVDSPRRRGMGLAISGSAVVVFISGLFYALIFLPWFENQ
ncbi:hypothetical protein [[Mycobacterium] crassicus]|uniref:Uncharacterized protein n=1 Tax=[Mycobacterium] crassicus TaxID=2872309 RepID=A0ABU5XIA0_9MYCO|nr:hypothetical protein [Mycolicibacter sp. MYC098]MEB3021507.1 hypothetical protein [Mycolicibacter sp. MYC098]